MLPFWAMSDKDKTLLVLKFLLLAYGWAMLIVGAIAVMCFFMQVAQDVVNRLNDRRENRRDEFSPTTDPQVTAFKLQQTRRHIRSEQDEFFRNVQELHNDLR